MKQSIPDVFKPMSKEDIRLLIEREYLGKEQGVDLEDVFTPEQMELIRNLVKSQPS